MSCLALVIVLVLASLRLAAAAGADDANHIDDDRSTAAPWTDVSRTVSDPVVAVTST